MGYGSWNEAPFIISARSRGPLTCVLTRGTVEFFFPFFFFFKNRVLQEFEEWILVDRLLEYFSTIKKYNVYI